MQAGLSQPALECSDLSRWRWVEWTCCKDHIDPACAIGQTLTTRHTSFPCQPHSTHTEQCFAHDQYVTPAPILVPPQLSLLALLSCCRTCQSVAKCCVYGMAYMYTVHVIPVCFDILPDMAHHNVESGMVSRPIAATCNITAAMPRDREHTLLLVLYEYHSGHSRSRQCRGTKGSRRSRVQRDFYHSCSRAKLLRQNTAYYVIPMSASQHTYTEHCLAIATQ